MSTPNQFPQQCQIMELDLSALVQTDHQSESGTPPIETLLALEHQVTTLLALPCTRAEFNSVNDVEQVYCQGVIAIGTIAANKLYRFAYPTKYTGLETYFRSKFNLSRAQVYRFLNCSVVVKDLLSAPAHLIQFVRPVPLRQRVAKAIKDLASSPSDRQVLWATVLMHQPKGVDVTSTDVYRVARLIEKYRATNETWCPAPFRSLVQPDTYPSPDCARLAYPSPVIKQWRNRPAGKAPVPINQTAGYDTTALQCLAQVALHALGPHSVSPCLPNPNISFGPFIPPPSPVSPNYPSDMHHFQVSEPSDTFCAEQWHCALPSIHQVLESCYGSDIVLD